jgi:hypothetical protein
MLKLDYLNLEALKVILLYIAENVNLDSIIAENVNLDSIIAMI